MDKKDNKNTITLMGEEVTIRFNMATEIAYEEITGEPFDLPSFKSQKQNVALCMAAVIANNPGTNIDMKQFIHDVSAQEYTALLTAVTNSMIEWFQIPKALSDGDQAPKPKDDEDGKKNVPTPTGSTS